MTGPDPERERDEYARTIALFTDQLVAAVHHHDHDAGLYWLAKISEVDAPPGCKPTEDALIMACAQIDPNASLEARLAWCHPDVVNACRGEAS